MKWKIDIMGASYSEATEAIKKMGMHRPSEERDVVSVIVLALTRIASMMPHDGRISILARGDEQKGEIAYEIKAKSAESEAPAGKPGKSLKDGRGATISTEEKASIGERVKEGLTSFLRGKKGKESKDAKAG